MRPAALFAAFLALAAFAATALAEVKVGDAAPDFTLKDQDGKDVKLSSFAGKKNVVLAFYPKDFSGGCTTQMKCVQKELRKVEGHDFAVLAVSVDTVEQHANFAKSLGVQFRLLSDPDLAVAKLYDVAAAAGGYAARSAFVVDKEGKVRWLDRNLKVPQGTLEGTDLMAAIQKVGGKVDPLADLAGLPQAERDGKTLFVKFAKAFLAEDMNALDAILDPEACGKPGETPQMQKDRRKAQLDRWRTFADKHDLRALKFEEVVDLRGSRVIAKADVTPAALTTFGPEVREVAGRLAEGELLVIGRTTAPKVDDALVLPREVALRARKRGEAWTISEVCVLPN
jgi:peroxiredoxin Q/BCP